MNLKNRIAHLESQKEAEQSEAAPVDPEFQEYWQHITSDELVGADMEKAETLLATMKYNHAAIVKADCRAIVDLECYSGCLITELFFEMLLAAIEGRYAGPLSLAGNVIEAYQRKSAYKLGGMNCEDCGYIVPTYEA